MNTKIGRFSALACSNSVYITSYYQGIAYYYVMVKSGNTITTNLLMEKPTNEQDGVEISIKNISNIRPYDEALKFIVFFPNIYIEGAPSASSINAVKIKKYTNFAAATDSIRYHLLLGNVLYPCDRSHFSGSSERFLRDIEITGIVIKFDVGELDITPNRENIIYSSNTIKKIEQRIEEAVKEVNKNIEDHLAKDYDDFREYYLAISKTRWYDLVTMDHSTVWNKIHYGYKVSINDIDRSKVTYKGKDYSPFINDISSYYNCLLPNLRGTIYEGKLYKNLAYKMRSHCTLLHDKIVILNKNARIVEAAKQYLKEHYEGYDIVTEFDLNEFKIYLHECLGAVFQDNDYLNEIFENINKRAVKLDLNANSDYLKYKKEFLSNSSEKKIKDREIILYVYRCHYSQKYTFKNIIEAASFIKDKKSGVVLQGASPNNYLISSVASLRGYVFIRTRKDVIKDLKTLGLTCIVDVNWLLNEDPMISKAASVLKHFPSSIDRNLLCSLCVNMPGYKAKEFKNIYNISRTYCNDYSYKTLLDREGVKCDPYTEYLCRDLVNLLKKHREIVQFAACNDIKNEDIITTLIVKTKAYRVSGAAYKRMKRNSLIKILCKK